MPQERVADAWLAVKATRGRDTHPRISKSIVKGNDARTAQ